MNVSQPKSVRFLNAVFAPIPDHAFFEQAVLKGQISDAFLQSARFTAQVLDFPGVSRPRCIPSKTPLTLERIRSNHELFGPRVIQALGIRLGNGPPDPCLLSLILPCDTAQQCCLPHAALPARS